MTPIATYIMLIVLTTGQHLYFDVGTADRCREIIRTGEAHVVAEQLGVEVARIKCPWPLAPTTTPRPVARKEK